MEYEEWLNTIFEETYPAYPLAGGRIVWAGQETIKVEWDGTAVIIDLCDFYDSDDHNPTETIVRWAYSNLPLHSMEYSTGYAYYQHETDRFRSIVLRDNDCLVSAPIDNPYLFKTFSDGASIKHGLVFDNSGSVVSVSTRDKRLPATISVSNPEIFDQVFSDYFDYHPELCIMVPDRLITNTVFMGHRNSINRLNTDFSPEKSGVFSLSDWFARINKIKGRKDV